MRAKQQENGCPLASQASPAREKRPSTSGMPLRVEDVTSDRSIRTHIGRFSKNLDRDHCEQMSRMLLSCVQQLRIPTDRRACASRLRPVHTDPSPELRTPNGLLSTCHRRANPRVRLFEGPRWRVGCQCRHAAHARDEKGQIVGEGAASPSTEAVVPQGRVGCRSCRLCRRHTSDSLCGRRACHHAPAHHCLLSLFGAEATSCFLLYGIPSRSSSS